MKINRNILEFRPQLIALLILCLMSSTLMAQNIESTVLVKTAKLKTSGVQIKLYEIETEILSSQDNKVKIEFEYLAKGKDEEVAKLKKLLEQHVLTVLPSGDLNIDLSFQNNFDVEIMGMKWSKLTFKSNKKETVSLKEFKVISLKIWLPSQVDISLQAKYSKVNIQHNIEGVLNLDAYDGQLVANSFSGNVIGKAKYSKVTLGNANNINLSLYETTLKAEEANNIELAAKYSDITVKSIENLDLEIYEGSLLIPTLSSAVIKSKYAELRLGTAKKLTLDAYEGSCQLGDINSLKVKAKYLEITADKIETLELTEAYENTVIADVVDSLKSIDGKYNKFSFGKLMSSIFLSGYEDEIDVKILSSDFSNVEISGKYIDTDLSIKSPEAYRLNGNIQYPNLNIDESIYRIRTKIGDDNKLQFEFEFDDAQESSPQIDIKGYEMDIRITHT